jgi:benzylsuccinate CoA-transferase BbsF subunit
MKKKRALEGVKIADFTWMGVGPLSTKYVCNLGAEAIHIESKIRPDMTRTSMPYKDWQPGLNRSGVFSLYNDSKYSLTLNLKIPQAQQLARRIIYQWADVVVDSHLPGVMEEWGLDYETLRKEKPGLIHIATSMQGKTGPYSRMPGHGIAGSQLTGFSVITGWPDREPTVPFGAYSDFTAFPFMVTALVAALIYRRRTGKGQYIDLSQLEACIQFLAPPIMDYMINGRILTRMGNRCTHAAPHAVYRCLGEEKWCAIAVESDEEWESFRRVMGDPEWTKSPKFATFRDRKSNEDALNALVEEWTRNYSPDEVMNRLQEAGVAAGVVSSGEDVVTDPQLKHRGFHVILDHPEMGPHIYNLPAYRMSKTPPEITSRDPLIGEHNEYILKEVLRMSDDEIADLLIAGALE